MLYPHTRTSGIAGLARRSFLGAFAATALAATLPFAAPSAQAEGDLVRYDSVYHPESGSYFQLVRDTRLKENGLRWHHAVEASRQLTYKGRPGRLAVVADPSVHALLLKAYPNRANLGYGGRAWIGLRYWCGTRMLTWVTLEQHSSSAFGPWAHPWHRSQVTCANGVPYMGVFYQTSNQWQAEGPLKRFPFYFVEYPAQTAAGS